jgi:hypothetical protein
MPDFRLETEMTDNLELKEIIDSDEELSQALQDIEEASTDTVADDVNQLRAQSSKFAQLDDDQKENIVNLFDRFIKNMHIKTVECYILFENCIAFELFFCLD